MSSGTGRLRRKTARLLAAGTASGLALATVVVGVGAGKAGATASTQTRGVLTAAATVDPGQLPLATGSSAGRVMPLLRRPHGAAPAALPPAPSVPGAQRAAGSTLANFDGVTASQNKAVNGFDLEPPDEGLGAGNGYVFNLVNVTGIIYNEHGARLRGPFAANAFFHEPASTNTSDPRTYFDPSTHAWFATILEYRINSAGHATESHVDVAVNPSGDPTTSWTVYRIPTTDSSHTGCPCLADYPIFGIDQYNVYVSTNEFTSSLTSFNGAQLYAVSKSQLVRRATHVNVVHFDNLSVGGALGYHVQPATTYGNPGVEYLLSSLDPNSTFDNRLGVYALTNPGAVTSGRGQPNLSARVVGSEAYGLPPSAHTPPGFCSGSDCRNGRGAPTTGVVQTDDDAMQSAEYIGGHLVGALTTAVTIPGDPGERSGVAYFDVAPSVSGGVISSATHLRSQGYLAAQGEYLFYPYLSMAANGVTAMTFGIGGPSTFLSAAYAVMGSGSSGFGPIRLAAGGTTPDNGFTGTAAYGGAGRWGDYSAGELIPGTNRVWLATQYIPNAGDGNANWGNRVFELQL